MINLLSFNNLYCSSQGHSVSSFISVFLGKPVHFMTSVYVGCIQPNLSFFTHKMGLAAKAPDRLPIQRTVDLLLSSIKFHFKFIMRKIKPTWYPLQHASSFVQLLCVVFVKSSDKLLNYLMFCQTLSENGNTENSRISPLVKFFNFVM